MPPEIQTSDTVRHRKDFAKLCNDRTLFYAVEVGTECGAFARDFLQEWKGHRLWCVDPYEPYREMRYDRTADLMMAVQLLAPFTPRVKIIRLGSIEAAKSVNMPTPIDFVYIDAAHDYESVKADIEAWWPRVATKGILAGHDFDAGHRDVRRAVMEFAESQGLTIHVTQDHDSPASWYVNKP